MIQGTILKHVKDRIFEVEIPEVKNSIRAPEPKRLTIAHDYVQFGGPTTYYMKADKNGKYPFKGSGAANHLSSYCSLQIGIREFKEVYLPMLLEHEYLQDEHLADRVYEEDDTYWEKRGLEGPRWQKGDKYPSYAYSPAVIQYYDKENETSMVAFRATGEKSYSKVSLKVYNQIKGSFNLHNLQEVQLERMEKRRE